MLNLPINEQIIFISVIFLYLAAAVLGVIQIRIADRKYKSVMTHLFALALVLEAVFLIFRAISSQKFPLTSVFESMVVLTLLFGIIYLVLGIFIQEVWFGSAMSWLIFTLAILTGIIAKPAQATTQIATKPWAIAHGLAMIAGAAMILLATVSACVYLLGTYRLKKKKVTLVIGKIPNIQTLENYTSVSLKASLIFVSLGLASGIVGAYLEAQKLNLKPIDWITDPKILGILSVWILLSLILIAQALKITKARHTAQATIIIFVIVIFTFVGTKICGSGSHNFTTDKQNNSSQIPAQQYKYQQS